MDDALTPEEYGEGEETTETSGVLVLDGESWRNRGVLAKNYYIDPEAVAALGAGIERVMTEADQAMEEASEIIAGIASLTERVPAEIRCSELLDLCGTAQAEIKSFDFLSYGKRVNQGLLNLIDHNQYIMEDFIRKMRANTERAKRIGEEFRSLTDMITYSGGSAPMKGTAFSAVGNAEIQNTDGTGETVSGQENGEDIDRLAAQRETMISGGLDILSRRLDGEVEPNEKEWICTYIRLYNPSMLINLYVTDCYSSADSDKVYAAILDYYAAHKPVMEHYTYPAKYIEGIIMGYETHKIENGRFVLDNGGHTIAYGHDIKEGEEAVYANGLSMEDGLKLAISDLDEKYEVITTCISEINEITGMNISVNDFTENEMVFFLDFSYNRHKGLVSRPKTDADGNLLVNSSLAILIIAVWEKDYDKIIYTLGEETLSEEGEYYEGLERRRMDEYEILTMGDYERDYDIERECNGWEASINRP